MSGGNPFTPRVYQEPQRPVDRIQEQKVMSSDKVGAMVVKIIQYLTIALLFLVPVFFVPGLPASLGFDKVLVAASVASLSVILLGLAALRCNRVSTTTPLPLGIFWLFVIAAFLSGLLSGDIQDSLRGSVFEAQTAGFFAVLGLSMTLPLILQRSKIMTLRALLYFAAAAAVIVFYTTVRLFLSPGMLSFKSFASASVSPVGSFNDLAIFCALTIIFSLITLLLLPLKRSFQIGLSVLSLLSLMLMAVVNFFHLWIVVGFFGLLLLVYIFARDALLYRSQEDKGTQISPYLVGTTLVVCIVSILFVVAGDYVGTKIARMTDINYIEVRPSVTATLDVMQSVYRNDAFLGVGPNRFSDAWRLHKDQSINETIFWNTNFNAGFGYIPTLFITLGLLGGVAIIAFHISYVYLGYRMLLKGVSSDTFWYYFGVVSFVSATFLWGISYVYVSGPVILLLAALFTGLSFVAYQALVPAASVSVPLVTSRRRGFLLMAIVIVVITGCVSAMFTLSKQYVAQAQFTSAVKATSPEELDSTLAQSYQQYKDDAFVTVSARAKLSSLRAMLSLENPSQEDQQKFIDTAVSAMAAAEEAIRLDPTNPNGHALLADILIVLAGVGFDDAENRANGKLEDAKWRDPQNPVYDMMGAYLAVQMKDTTLARTRINEALQLKRNYSEALFLLSQLDINDGNIDAAIETTRQMITLETNNPTRYYQLGVLLAAKKDFEASVVAYKEAVKRDKNYANARYMMALTLLEIGRQDEALEQLRIVRETNQENEQLGTLISQVENGTYVAGQQSAAGATVSDPAPQVQQNGENVTAPGNPNTDLVTPVNTVTEGQEAAQ